MLLNQQVLKEIGILIGQKGHGLVIHKIIGADEFSFVSVYLYVPIVMRGLQ